MTHQHRPPRLLTTWLLAAGLVVVGAQSPVAAAGPTPTIETVLDTASERPLSVVVDQRGDVTMAFATQYRERVVRRTSDGTVTTLRNATNCPEYLAWPPPGPAGTLCRPQGLSADAAGNVYVAAPGSGRIYRITPSGALSTVAGNGSVGYTGDGGPATDAAIVLNGGKLPATAVAPNGDLYFSSVDAIRKVDAGGIISTVAGGPDWTGSTGDGGPFREAGVIAIGLAFEADGDLLILGDGRLRRVDAATQVIDTIAGTGVAGWSGDGGPAIDAQIEGQTLSVGPGGEIFIGTGPCVVRMIDTDGIISTIAGNGTCGYTGDGGPAVDATVFWSAVAADPSTGDLYLGDGSVTKAGLRRITRRGALGGVVSDGADGALAGVTVTVMAEWPAWSVVATTTTAADGSWRVEDLPAGRYRVRLFDGAGRFVRTWWPAQDAYKRADPLEVMVASETTANAAVAVAASSSLTGRVTDATTGTPLAGALVQVFSNGAYVAGAVTGPAGYYQLHALPAGDYQVRFVDPTPRAHQNVWYPGVPDHPSAGTVMLVAGVTVVDASLPTWP